MFILENLKKKQSRREKLCVILAPEVAINILM